jgi:TolB-like protein
VLPFANTSSDPEQDYFADGIVEDVSPRSPADPGCS